MNISLTPELEKYVHAKVIGGFYSSASEVIRESLRLMHSYDDLNQQKLLELNKDIEMGLISLNQGEKISASASYARMKKKIENLQEKVN